MSLMPAAAKTSASPTFAQPMPAAPRSICIFATMGDLWVFACGRRRMPALDASCCTRSMLFRRRGRSMTTCGVGRSASVGTTSYCVSGEQPGEFRRLNRVAGEDRPWIGDAEVADDDLAEDVAEIGRDREVAPVVALLDREAGPPPVHFSAANAAADDHHRVAVPVIGAAVAVLAHRAC